MTDWNRYTNAELGERIETLEGQTRSHHGLGNDLFLAMAEIKRLESENAKLREVTWYWDERDLDHAVEPDEAVAYDDVGDIVVLRPLHELPPVWVLITDGDVAQFFGTREAAEKARKKCLT